MISLEQARIIVSAARAHGREHGLKPLTVVVLDPGGHVVALEREDGSGYGRPQIAQGKAAGALAMGTSSRALGEMAADRPQFIAAVSVAWEGKLIPAAGGVVPGMPIPPHRLLTNSSVSIAPGMFGMLGLLMGLLHLVSVQCVL